jgi:L-seryl-tRNA(Ser) seleniumtransferase
MPGMSDTRLRKLPSIDSLLGDPAGAALVARFGREAFVRACREDLDARRADILGGTAHDTGADERILGREAVLVRVGARLDEKASRGLKKTINATGILMHSGLGRAVLSDAARTALDDITRGYCNLALDPETGRRGHRDVQIGRLLTELTGAEAATICNNNAAGTVLVLHALASGKDVVVSRGQLVEIGGSFRMPEVMAASGAAVREVGTTNKTHLRDYEATIGPNTGALLRVHHSNYRIVGFAAEPEIEELAELGRKAGIPVIDDLGSGALVDLRDFGLETEPLVRRSIAAGVAVACFSGDKLIGGPQSGLIVGKAEAVARIKKDPLARAFRCGKLTIAAMEATLKLFLDPDTLAQTHPLYRMLSLTPESLGRRARRVERGLRKRAPADVGFSVVDEGSQVGSGSVPVETLPTKCLAVTGAAAGPDALARALRFGRPPVYARIKQDAVLFDFRTIRPEEDRLVEDAIAAALVP